MHRRDFLHAACLAAGHRADFRFLRRAFRSNARASAHEGGLTPAEAGGRHGASENRPSGQVVRIRRLDRGRRVLVD